MSLKAIQEFEYHAPKTVDEALKLLAEYGETAKIMAGGTDLIPKMKGGAATAASDQHQGNRRAPFYRIR